MYVSGNRNMSDDLQYQTIFLKPYKQLQQYIVYKWLYDENNEDYFDKLDKKQFLIEIGVLSAEEARFFEVLEAKREEKREGEIDYFISPDFRSGSQRFLMRIYFQEPKQVVTDTAPREYKEILRDFLKSDSNSPDWNLPGELMVVGTGVINFVPEEPPVKIETPFNLIKPSKKLSQLLAKSWLEKAPVSINRDFFINNDLLSDLDKQYVVVNQVDLPKEPGLYLPEEPGPYVGLIKVESDKVVITIPYSTQPPPDLKEEDLRAWVENDREDEVIPPPVCLIASTTS